MNAVLATLATGLAEGSMLALVALGYSLVFGVLRLINFAHGEVFMMGAYAGLFATTAFVGVLPPLVALVAGIAVAMVLAALLGMGIERFAYRPLTARAPRSAMAQRAPLVTALAVSVLLQNVAQLAFSSRFRPFPRVLEQPRPVVIVVAALVALGLQWLVKKTYFGLALRTISVSTDAARIVGVPVHKVVSRAFALGSSLAALGAVLFCLDQSQVYPTLGVTIGMRAFVAAVLGGIGSIPGAFVGGLAIGVLGELVKLSPYSGGLDAVVFAVLVVVLLVRPEGLVGKRVPIKV